MWKRFLLGTSVILVATAALASGASVVKSTASATGSPVAQKAASGSASPATSLGLFTVNDLQAALADAQANNDPIASACYSALIPLVQAQNAPVLPKSLGAIQLFQRARDLQRAGSDQSARDKVTLACGPLVLDTQNTALLLAARVGIAIPGGLAAKGALAVGGTASVGLISAILAGLKALPSN